MKLPTADEIRDMPTLCVGQCCSLKIVNPGERIWLCRVAGGVTRERYNARAGRWEVTDGGCNE